MLDRIASDDHELPLPIKLEGIDDSKAWLTATNAAFGLGTIPRDFSKDPSKNSQKQQDYCNRG
jgi:hypothetical protein